MMVPCDISKSLYKRLVTLSYSLPIYYFYPSEENLEEMAVKLSCYGPEEIIITFSSKGSLINCKPKFYQIPSFKPKNHVDPTGCGDTYLAGYLYQRIQGIDNTKAGEFAARTDL